MLIFNQTIGGTYQYDQYGKKVTYTFPSNASISINGVTLSLSELQVQCYGGKYDQDSTLFFSKIFSKTSPHVSQYNSEIFINDNDVAGFGYPSRGDFKAYNIDFISKENFRALQERVNAVSLPSRHPEYFKLFHLITFFKQWSLDKCMTIKQQISALVDDNSKPFPKAISLIYDDRMLKHTTHIVLTFNSKTNCTLRIDNTLSIAYALLGNKHKQFQQQHQINILTCKESVLPTEPKFLILYKDKVDETSAVKLELSDSVENIILKQFYDRMVDVLKTRLNLPIKRVQIYFSPYNQKNTDECVPFALQNKLDFIGGRTANTGAEIALQMSVRIRAEHVVLSYLLDKAPQIAHANEEDCQDGNFNYPLDEWYANYSEVGERLKKTLSELSFLEIQQLYLDMELNGICSISPNFKSLLVSLMTDKFQENDYVSMPLKACDQMLQEGMAPSILYDQNKKMLFFSKRIVANLSNDAKSVLSEHGIRLS